MLQFDPVRDLLPHGAEYGIDKDSLGRSHFIHRSVGRASRFIPAFAYCTPQLQRVIALRAHRFAHSTAPFPMEVSREKLDADCTAHVERVAAANPACRNTARLQAAVSRGGTYMGFLASLCWKAWRSLPTPTNAEIAADFGIAPSQVIIQLAKLVQAAENLGFPVYEIRAPMKGRKRRDRRPIDVQRILRLWSRGKSVPAIAKAVGDSDRRVRRTLREAGIVINLSESKRRAWRRPEYRKHRAAGMKAAWRNPATRPALLAQIRAARAKGKINPPRNTVVSR